MINETALVNLFLRYTAAFKCYDLSTVKQCYQLPCTLHTPDKVVYLASEIDLEKEFIQIFTVLQNAKISDIKITKATFNVSVNGAIDMCIDWAFIDENNKVFTDFCAFYHLVEIEEQFKIISVVSHELSNSVELPFNVSSKLLRMK
ncbi:MAG: hypothetical protein P8I03_14460 [Thalassotalea sp.]|nr:hypothetical protein [Thalassotalea sp.]